VQRGYLFINIKDITAEKLNANSIEIILGIDDIISVGGYREGVNMTQILQYLQMESQEEKAYLKEKKQKENEQKEVLKKKMKEFESQKKEKKKYDNSVSR